VAVIRSPSIFDGIIDQAPLLSLAIVAAVSADGRGKERVAGESKTRSAGVTAYTRPAVEEPGGITPSKGSERSPAPLISVPVRETFPSTEEVVAGAGPAEPLLPPEPPEPPEPEEPPFPPLPEEGASVSTGAGADPMAIFWESASDPSI